MSNSLVKTNKRNLAFAVNHYFAFACLLAIPIMSACWMVTASDGFVFVAMLFLLVVSLWSLTPSLVCLPLSVYLQDHYLDREYGKIDRAYSRAIAILDKLPVRRTLATSTMLSNLGLVRLCQGNYDSAENLFRKALEQARKNKRFAKHWFVALLLNNLAAMRCRQKQYVEAELLATEGLEIMELPKNAKRSIIKSVLNSCLGCIRLELKEFESAEEHLYKARNIYESSKPTSVVIPSSQLQSKVIINLNLALVHAYMGKWDEADRDCDTTLEIIQQSGAISTMSLKSLNMLANEYMNKRDFARAEKLIEIAYETGRPYCFHPDAQLTLSYYEKLFLLTDRQKEVADMRSWLRAVPLLQGTST